MVYRNILIGLLAFFQITNFLDKIAIRETGSRAYQIHLMHALKNKQKIKILMCSIREEKSDILIVGFWLGIISFICGMVPSSLFNSTFSLDRLRLFSLNTVLSINTWAGFTLFSTSFGLTSHLLLYFLVMGAVGFTLPQCTFSFCSLSFH
jgi:hypothetical protein